MATSYEKRKRPRTRDRSEEKEYVRKEHHSDSKRRCETTGKPRSGSGRPRNETDQLNRRSMSDGSGRHRQEEQKHGGRHKQRSRETSGARQSNLRNSDRPESSDIKTEKGTDKDNSAESEKPNFGLSGKLTEDTNTYRGVVIKYNEPPEARKPKKKWRLYPFKGDTALPVLHVHRQSAFLIGRDRRVADIPSDHPSCSKQHAVLQFRLVEFTREDGTTGRRVRPYIIDLESANGTYVNNNRIESQRYVELLERDVVKFGFSSREYVMLLETSNAGMENEDEPLTTP